MEFRKVEILKDNQWTIARMSEVKAGDVIRLTEHGNDLGVWLVSKDAQENENGVWGVEAKEVDEETK